MVDFKLYSSSSKPVYHGVRKKCDLSWFNNQLLYSNFPSGADKSVLAGYHRIEGNRISIHPLGLWEKSHNIRDI